MQTQANSDSRNIRVFISSTFRDMQHERDELAKFIFPQLRKLCEQRGVTWGEVDLRWGITNEQKSDGKVLPICLDEIQRCRPYFIGLLGERYGWIPDPVKDPIPPDLIEREPWLKEHLDQSVTELEILHGVLNDPEMANHAFFYCRDPSYIKTLPVEQQFYYLEEVTSEDIQEYGPEEAARRAEARRGKLAALKERIHRSGLPYREGYRDPRQLGEWVHQDLFEVIERLYPEGSQLNPLAREAAEHETFANSRLRVYISRPAYFDQLDEHVRSNGQPLVILGESGSGKSALLANWAIKYRKEHPNELVLMHFIGATPASADWAAMLRRILGEFKRKFDIQAEVPDQPDALRSAFANWLNMVAARGRVVLILDALNQLEDRDGAPDLVWLPPHIPENIRIFFSTLPGRPLNELQKRSWPVVIIEPLQPEERKQLIHEYLAHYTKALSPAHTDRIIRASQCQSPLFLRVLLEELRLFGEHERLGERIDAYLEAPTIPALYELILNRCEQDYERDRSGLVRDSMTLLWAARRGLAEAELMDMLGKSGQPLPRAQWSPLFLAVEQSLVNRSGLIGFGHEYLRKVVEMRYLSNRSLKLEVHRHLADYFQNRETTVRRLNELPWQLAQIQDWDRLYHLLSDLTFFEQLWNENEADTKSYWAQVEQNSTFRKTLAYKDVLSEVKADCNALHHVATLFVDTGQPDRATAIWEALSTRYSGTPFAHEVFLGAYAVALLKSGRIDDGIRVLEEQARYTKEDFSLVQAHCFTLGNIGVALCDRGDFDQALRLFEDQESLARKIKDNAALRISVNNQATILARQQRFDEALGVSLEAEQLCREAGDMNGLAASLGNQGMILLQWHRHAPANEKLDQASKIFERLGDTNNLATLFGARAALLCDLNEFGEALTLLEAQERLCEMSSHLHGKVIARANLARVLYELERRKEAMSVAQEVIEFANSHGFHEVEQYLIDLVRQWRIQL